MHPTTQYSEAALLGGVVPGLRSPRRRGRAGLLDEQLFTLCFQVTLCSNTVQKYELALVVDVEGIGEEVLALLITARYHSPAPSSQSPRPGQGCLSRRQQTCKQLTLHLFGLLSLMGG